jgi:thioredoxin-like negative regulator of GroEL
MAPIIDKVVAHFDNLELVKVDADKPENEELLRDYDVRSIPTLVLLNEDGEIISALSGTHTEQQLRDWIISETGVDDKLEEIREDLDAI